MQLKQIINEWLDHLKNHQNYSVSSCKAYSRDLQHFINFTTNYLNVELLTLNHLSSVDIRLIRSWLADRKSHQYHASSSSRSLSGVKNFYRYLLKYRAINSKVLEFVPSIKTPRRLPKALDIEDSILAISKIEHVSEDSWIGARDKAIMFLLYGQGLRISEALSITKMQVDTELLRILGKGNKTRVIPWLQEVKIAVKNYLQLIPYKLNYDSLIFLGKRGKTLKPSVFGRNLIKLRRSLNLSETVTPHSFRHCFASHLLNNGADLRSIQELLGHQNLSSTQLYTSVNINHLTSVYNSSHPLMKKYVTKKIFDNK